MWFLNGFVFIDWAARDREIQRQMSEGVVNLDKINAAATMTRVTIDDKCP